MRNWRWQVEKTKRLLFAKRLKVLREIARWTPDQMASELKIPVAQYSLLESGILPIHKATIRAVQQTMVESGIYADDKLVYQGSD